MPKRKDQDGLYKRGDSPFWWASYTDASGQRTRCSTQTADRKDAEALLAKWKLAAYQEKHWDAPPIHTFDELILGYLAENTHKRSADRDQYSAKQLYPLFTGRSLDTLTPSDVRSYITRRQTDGVKPATINKELRLLSAALNYAKREWEWSVNNPVNGRTLREPESRTRWLQPEEATALIAAARAEPKAPHLVDFILLALHTGMRRGELLGLEWNRVDLKTDTVILEAVHTKSAKRRHIPLNRIARSTLLHRANFRATHCPASLFVFCDQEGQRIKSVRRSFDAAVRRAGLMDFHIHDLRHTCAAWLVNAGVPMPEIRDLLGHSCVSMTEKYAHLAPENVRVAVATLEDASRSGHAPLELPEKSGQ